MPNSIRAHAATLAVVAPALLFGLVACSAGDASIGTEQSELGGHHGRPCHYDGESYREGDTFPSSDGCNTCSCTSGGAVFCTKRACLIDAGVGADDASTPIDGDASPAIADAAVSKDAGTCDYGGAMHADGDSFPSTDGCNTCSCAGGSVLCTKRMCVADAARPSTCTYDGKTYSEGEGFPSSDGCNACSCMSLGRVFCTKRACFTP